MNSLLADLRTCFDNEQHKTIFKSEILAYLINTSILTMFVRVKVTMLSPLYQ
jgi:hypothetical protein